MSFRHSSTPSLHASKKKPRRIEPAGPGNFQRD
jgi:hypothetical protein